MGWERHTGGAGCVGVHQRCHTGQSRHIGTVQIENCAWSMQEMLCGLGWGMAQVRILCRGLVTICC